MRIIGINIVNINIIHILFGIYLSVVYGNLNCIEYSYIVKCFIYEVSAGVRGIRCKMRYKLQGSVGCEGEVFGWGFLFGG